MSEDGERAVFDVTGIEKVPVSLADLNTTKKESADAQALAEEAETVRDWMGKAKAVTSTRAARVARDARAARRRKEKRKGRAVLGALLDGSAGRE